jgi:phenylalanyl-tRNA synthetase beta chain
MRISTNWLRGLTQIDAVPADIAERLTRAGVAVDVVRRVGDGALRVVVAAVKSSRRHPEREALTLVDVDDGAGGRTVVCGAPNVPAPGGRVALALEGAKIGEITVAARKFAGFESRGMLCSEAELGVGPDADGILILEDAAAPGTPLSTAFALEDHVLELDLTPNRGDCLGHVGVAREVCALFGQPFAMPEPDAPPRVASSDVSSVVTVIVEDEERCPRYMALGVTGLTVSPSPFWLRYRLHTLGVRPISNLVDVTNLILLEFGQPLHAFDLDRLRGGRIVVRRARVGESMSTLDGVSRALDPDDLLICDGTGPVALAGVMGGAGSEVLPTTTNVLVECACFEPRGILRTARRLTLHTDSSHRFERGTDVSAMPLALQQAASTLSWLGGGAVLRGVVDTMTRPIEPRVLSLRSSHVTRLLGDAVPPAESSDVLRRLGFGVVQRGDDMEVTVPAARNDVTREVDLIEEVARVRGYDRIPTRYPAIRTGPAIARVYPWKRRARHTLAALGLDEAVSYSFCSPADLRALRLPPVEVKLLNPLTEERSVLRTSLLPGLCAVVARARRVAERVVRVFEVGTVFGGSRADGLADEQLWATGILAGPRDGWLDKPADVDFYDAKGLALELCRLLVGLAPEVELAADAAPYLHPRSSCRLRIGDAWIGRVGEIHPEVAEAVDLGGTAAVFELDLGALRRLPDGRRFEPLPRFPAVTRDVALLVDIAVRFSDVERAARESATGLLEHVEVFDLYRGEQVPAGKKSIAFSLRYRAPDRTLTDAEVDLAHGRVVEACGQKLGGQTR